VAFAAISSTMIVLSHLNCGFAAQFVRECAELDIALISVVAKSNIVVDRVKIAFIS
jgi:hypothetical protein